jgi:hypothetical protein
MDKALVVKWLAGIVARGVAWILAAKFGMDAATSQADAQSVAEALAALALVAASVYSSIKGRRALLTTEPPLIKS